MNSYETIVIINPTLEDEKINKVIENITETIKKLGGKVDTTEIWGRRKLAYPIQKHQEGYYCLINFGLDTEGIDELNRFYNVTEEIIKHIIVKKDND